MGQGGQGTPPGVATFGPSGGEQGRPGKTGWSKVEPGWRGFLLGERLEARAGADW